MTDYKTSIGERSSIQIGVILSVVGFLVGGVWWASSVNTKVDTLLLMTQAQNAMIVQLKTDHNALEKRVTILEQKPH